MLQKILLAIGDSTETQAVVDAGLILAEKFGAQMLLLHVINPSTPNGFSPLVGGMFPIVNDIALEQYAKEWKEYETQGIERLQTYAAQAKERGVKVEVSQNFGDSGKMICELAKNWSAETIVMGRNQKSMLSEIFLGSTSNYVVHHAPCSVMVIQLPALAT
ncbi:universal stress protein [Chamaesiphon sp. OTE_75_metabat_556]|uniref:universal stress protein n=1 Tax=Chamaesiphon sp. OTE_75_metabat_556 TaxID=2964692 RepID=UPI00286B2368|nr:universal stress protein [Chamaesiphon sp. OTE_75_metabat_556]